MKNTISRPMCIEWSPSINQKLNFDEIGGLRSDKKSNSSINKVKIQTKIANKSSKMAVFR